MANKVLMKKGIEALIRGIVVAVVCCIYCLCTNSPDGSWDRWVAIIVGGLLFLEGLLHIPSIWNAAWEVETKDSTPQ